MTEKRLATAIALLVAAAVAVPFALLTGVERLAGSFLFWTLFALGVIGLIVRSTSGWKGQR